MLPVQYLLRKKTLEKVARIRIFRLQIEKEIQLANIFNCFKNIENKASITINDSKGNSKHKC